MGGREGVREGKRGGGVERGRRKEDTERRARWRGEGRKWL